MTTITFEDMSKDSARILRLIEQGEEIIIRQGDNEKLAIIVPYARHEKKPKRKLGVLKGKASYGIKAGFKMSDEEFLAS